MGIKKKTLIYFFRYALFFAVAFLFLLPVSSHAQSANQIEISGYLVGSQNKEIKNGDYEVRFSIYTVNREERDVYPSNTDQSIWEETQIVLVTNGIFNTYLGAENPLPDSLTFQEQDYYLGVRINEDSEMVPRKKLASVPKAINSKYLEGRSIGEEEGNIPLLGTNGKIEKAQIPTITNLGVVTVGTWNADKIKNKYIEDALTDKTYNGLNIKKSNSAFTISGGSTLVISQDSEINQNLTTSSSPTFSNLTLSGQNPLTLTQATLSATPKTGAFEYDGNALYFTPDSTRREVSFSGLDDDAVTLVGAYDYLTLSGQQITLNQIDVSSHTNLAVSGTLLDLTDDTFSINEGTLTDGRLCVYSSVDGIVCDTLAREQEESTGQDLPDMLLTGQIQIL